MGTLIILGTAILGGLVCSKQTLYQSWIFLVNLAFSVYLALLLAPLVRDLAQPSLNLGRELVPYLTPAVMLDLQPELPRARRGDVSHRLGVFGDVGLCFRPGNVHLLFRLFGR